MSRRSRPVARLKLTDGLHFHVARIASTAWLVTLCAAWLVSAPVTSRGEEEFTFDASKYEKRTFDLGGYAELWPEYLPANKDGALYQLAFFGKEPEDNISRTTAVLDLEGRYNRDMLTFFFRTHSNVLWDYSGAEQEHELFEGVLSVQPSASFTIEAGKKANRWGKGTFWNAVGFIERPKDPNDPDLARQGFWMTSVDWVRSFDGPLQTVSFTPVAVPTVDGLNEDFGEPEHFNLGGKLYMLYRDTDFDFMFLTGGARTPRVGFDFSRNLAPNFEVHGEFAYITNFERIVIDPAPGCRTRSAGEEDVTSYLLGLRYRSERDIAYTLEYFVDGTGNSPEQQRRYYECVHTAWDEDQAALMTRLQSSQLARRFVRPNPMREYLGFRVAWNEPFEILYFTPALQSFYNLEDDSFQIAPELSYTGLENFEFRLRGTVPIGSTLTEWGEKANEYKIDLRMRYYF